MRRGAAGLVLGVGLGLAACSVQGVPEADPPASSGLSGPYLGQTPPGDQAAVFAPGIVNTGLYTRDVAMTPDGSEIYFGVSVGNSTFATIMVTRRENGEWTPPEAAPFATDPRWSDIEPFIQPDGRRMLFVSTRPANGGGDPAEHAIWAMDRHDSGWGEPYRLSDVVNAPGTLQYFPSVTNDGTLYFTRQIPGEFEGIYRSRFADGEYSMPERLPEQVNGGRGRYNAFVAPDESYLIVPTVGRDDSRGGTDYYVVFRAPDDTWSEAVNLGETVNTVSGMEWSPYVSPDGRYFFFMSARPDPALHTGALSAETMHRLHNAPGTGLPTIWWIDATFIERLRP